MAVCARRGRAVVPSAAVAAQELPTDVPTDVRDSAFTRVSHEQDVHVETTVPQLPKPVTSGARSGARPWAGVNYFPLERQIDTGRSRSKPSFNLI